MNRQSQELDAFFRAEFGDGEIGKRLWRGGLRASAEGYHLVKSPHVFTASLRNGLDVRFNEDAKIESIISDLEASWNDIGRLRRACQPIPGVRSNIYSNSSVSLIKHFLTVDLFQTPIISCLINKISELGEENSPDRDIAPLLLNQLRWLDFIVDGASLSENLLSILPIVPLSLQKDIIEAIPEILDDVSKPQAVSELIRILEESPSLMGSVIDALASLGVDDERLLEVNSSIVSSIGAANRDILPITIKYLIRTCPPDLLTPTVNALRNTLALPSLGPGPGKLCLDAVKYGLRISKSVAQHVLKTLRNLDKPTDFKPADFWLVTALYDSPANRKQTEALFRRKAGVGAFTRALMDAALAPFADAFADQTNIMIMLASVVVKSVDIGARRSGVSLYALLFKLFTSGNTRRNVVTSLAEHIGTRKVGEVDTALDALVLIAEEAVEDRSLLPYSGTIQNLLDFLECFTDSQLRQIWSVFGYVCCASEKNSASRRSQSELDGRRTTGSPQSLEVHREGSGEGELQMLEILLRKELRHPDTFYRRIGVIGACTMIKVLGSGLENNILAMLLEVGRAHPVSQAIAFDELAELFGQSNTTSRGTSESLRKTISTLFERKYLSECSGIRALVKDEKLLPAKLYGNLEGDDVELCFSIASLTRNEISLDESRDAVRSMAPNLRLLCVLTSNRFHGSLSDIDATIGAPLHIPVFPEDKDLDDICAEGKSDLLLNLFIAHGWIVELINGFAGQESNELRAKCVIRVDNLLDVTAQITKLIPHVPRWKDIIFDAYNGTRHVSLSLRQRALGKKTKFGKEAANGGSVVERNSEWKAMSRQLDSSALSLIRIRNPITWRYTETETLLRDGDPDVQTATLSVEALRYLLTELAGQVENAVGGLFQNSNIFSVAMFHTGSINVVKKDNRGGARESSADARLKKIRSFRAALESLGSQLSVCLDKVLSNEESAALREDEVTVKLYRECAVLCLKSYSLVLNSAILSDVFAHELLFDLLAAMRLDGQLPVEPSDPVTLDDVAIAAKIAFEQLHDRMNAIACKASDAAKSEGETEGNTCLEQLEFEGCCGMLAAMDSILQHCSQKQSSRLGIKLSKIAHVVLKHKWPEAVLRTRKSQRLIPGIVRIQVQYANDPLAEADQLRDIVLNFAQKQADPENRHVNTQDGMHARASTSGVLGSLIEQTSFPYSVSILDQYIFMFRKFKPGSFEKVEHAFEMMNRLIRAEQPLYSLARLNQRLLSPVMRAGRTFVELFLKVCLPYLNEKFKHYQGEVVQLCKAHQKPTRILQSFCAHSKSIQDTSLTGLVPPLRRCLELLLYQIKGLLHGHNATDAFQLGNLKHRDIHGELVNSQQVEDEEQEENADANEDEPAPDDVTKEEKDEILVMLTEEDADESASMPRGAKRRQNKGEGLLGSGKRKKSKQARQQKKAKPATRSTRESIARDLDFGSDVDNESDKAEKQRDGDNEDHDTDKDDLLNSDIPLDTNDRNNDTDEDNDDVIRRGRRMRGSLKDRPKSTQQFSRISWEQHDDVDVTQRKRCRLIDDEAGEGDAYEEDVEEPDLASQFIVGDDEVEE